MNPPVIRLTDQARLAVQRAAAESGGGLLRLNISDRFDHQLRFDAAGPDDVQVNCNGAVLLLDPPSAARADGVSIDLVEGPGGPGFKIENPNQPPTVRQLSAADLKSVMNGGVPFVLVDVRTDAERAIAKIDGSVLLDQAGHDYVMALDREATIVFQCHHGIRSQAAAEHFLQAGFKNVYNLRGGIDAWSQLVDPSVPRY